MLMLNGRLFDAATMDQLAPERDSPGCEIVSRRGGPGSWWARTAAASGAQATCSCGAGANEWTVASTGDVATGRRSGAERHQMTTCVSRRSTP